MKVLFGGSESQFRPEACELWQRNRIPKSPFAGKQRRLRWLHGDSEENYALRGNKDFSLDSISYALNEYGYRSDEFDVSARKPAFVFVGCSNTLGIGIPWDELWTTLVVKHFEKKWGRRIAQYNLAWSGTGPDHVAMMIHQCIDVLRPNAVFVLWSYIGRMTFFNDAKSRAHLLPERSKNISENIHDAFLSLSTDANLFFNYVRNYAFVEARLSTLGIPWICGNLEQFTDELLSHYINMHNFCGRWSRLDIARDNQHSGVKSHKEFSRKVISMSDVLIPQEKC
jgi:hypothetical protein